MSTLFREGSAGGPGMRMRSTLIRFLKHVAGVALQLYTIPLRMNERIGYFAKGVGFPAGEEHLYRTVRHIRCNDPVPAHSAIVDVGAAAGGTAMYFRKAFPKNQIVAFEPNPRMAQELAANTIRLGNIIVKNIALGASKRRDVLHITSNNLSSSLHPLDEVELSRLPTAMQGQLRPDLAVPVEVSTLDDELHDVREVLLIKLDTQGTELDILKGATEVLGRTQFVLTEMNNHSMYTNTCKYYEVDQFLRNNHFKLVDIIVSYYPTSGMQEYDALYRKAPDDAGGCARAEPVY